MLFASGPGVVGEAEVTLPAIATTALLVSGLEPRASYEAQLTSGFAPGSPVWQRDGRDDGRRHAARRVGRAAGGAPAPAPAALTRSGTSREESERCAEKLQAVAPARRSGPRSPSPVVDAAARSRPPLPKITAPVMFGTPEADRILEALQVFPPDNPWNQDVSKMPVAKDSAAIVASIGADKHLGYNLDMGFILVPPDQKRVPVKLLDYPNESDPGPYPVPDNAPIENWPLAVNEDVRGADEARPDARGHPEERHAATATSSSWTR